MYRDYRRRDIVAVGAHADWPKNEDHTYWRKFDPESLTWTNVFPDRPTEPYLLPYGDDYPEPDEDEKANKLESTRSTLNEILDLVELCYDAKWYVYTERLCEKGISLACVAAAGRHVDDIDVKVVAAWHDRLEPSAPPSIDYRRIIGSMLLRRSLARMQMGEYEAAIEDADDAIYFLRRDMKWKAYRQRGQACNLWGKTTEALGSYYNALYLPGGDACKMELEQIKRHLFSKFSVEVKCNQSGSLVTAVTRDSLEGWEELMDMMRGEEGKHIFYQDRILGLENKNRINESSLCSPLDYDRFSEFLDCINSGDIWQALWRDNFWETPAPSVWQRSYWSKANADKDCITGYHGDATLKRFKYWRHYVKFKCKGLSRVSTLDEASWTKQEIKQRNDTRLPGSEGVHHLKYYWRRWGLEGDWECRVPGCCYEPECYGHPKRTMSENNSWNNSWRNTISARVRWRISASPRLVYNGHFVGRKDNLEYWTKYSWYS